MRVHETNPTVAAKNRKQAGKAQLYGGILFAVGIVVVAMSGSIQLEIFPVIGLVVGCAGSMVASSNKVN